MKNKYWRIITLIAILFIVIAVTLLFNYYYFEKKTECINNPFVYGAKQMEETYGQKFIGSGYFIIPNSPIIYFDSINISIKK